MISSEWVNLQLMRCAFFIFGDLNSALPNLIEVCGPSMLAHYSGLSKARGISGIVQLVYYFYFKLAESHSSRTHHVLATVDAQVTSGGETGRIRGQKRNSCRHLRGLPNPTHWMDAVRVFQVGLVRWIVHPKPSLEVRNDDRWIDGVDANSLRCQLKCNAPRKLV